MTIQLLGDAPDIKALKIKRRKAKDSLTRAWFAALLEGLKDSPWYYDNNEPSLYRDRCMAIAAVAVVAIGQRHELAEECLKSLRNLRLHLPNTFATLPVVVQEWEAEASKLVDTGTFGTVFLRIPEKAPRSIASMHGSVKT